MSEAADALSTGFRLTSKQKTLIVRVLWVLAVTIYMTWTLGGLTFLGLSAPFARAEDVKDLKQQVGVIQEQGNIAARLQLVQEIRIQKRAYCVNTDQEIRNSILRTIDNLRSELKRVANVDEPLYPVCDAGKP